MRKEKRNPHDDGAYPEKKSGKANVFAFIVCILLALIIWLCAVNENPSNDSNDPSLDDTYQGELIQ